MSPKKEYIEFYIRKSFPVCYYCIHSNEDIPNKAEAGNGRLWCGKHQIIVKENGKVCQDYGC